MQDFSKIKAEYVRGNVSYRKLADKYGVSFSTLMKLGADEKWTDLRKKSKRKAEEKIVEKTAQRVADREDKIQHVADLLLGKIEEGVASGALIVDSQSIRQVTASIKDLREIKGYKSDLDIQEQMARIDKLRKEAMIEEKNNDINVVISGSLEDYSK